MQQQQNSDVDSIDQSPEDLAIQQPQSETFHNVSYLSMSSIPSTIAGTIQATCSTNSNNNIVSPEHDLFQSTGNNNQTNSNTIIPNANNDSKNNPIVSATATTASTSGDTTAEKERTKLIQEQLILLLHAYKCSSSSGTDANGQAKPACTVYRCAMIKEVMVHIALCTEGRACPRLLCVSSRQILDHWKNCTKASCPICGPIRGTSSKAKNKYKNPDYQKRKKLNNGMLNNQQIQQLQGKNPTASNPTNSYTIIANSDNKNNTNNNNPTTTTTAATAAAASTSSVTTVEQEKRKLIQQQLILLLHAYKCSDSSGKDANGQAKQTCAVNHCSTMKQVMAHITQCTKGRSCTRVHCASSRQILTHWKNCIKTNCPVCSPIRFNATKKTNSS
jgi:hypothetical protein